MSTERQPIKRSKELVPLSKEHHEGLLFGWKIRQGLANGTSAELIARFVGWFWENDLREHFRKEEEVLVPQLPADNEWVQKMWREHREIRELVERCTAAGDTALFESLAGAIHDHIRFEERVLFPYAEQALAPDVMATLYGQLNTETQKEPWTDVFWLRKKSGS